MFRSSPGPEHPSSNPVTRGRGLGHRVSSIVVALALMVPAIALASWRDAPRRFVVLSTRDVASLGDFVAVLEAAGGHASVVYPPRAAVVYADDLTLSQPSLRVRIAETHAARIEQASAARLGAETALAASAWNRALEWKDLSPELPTDLPPARDSRVMPPEVLGQKAILADLASTRLPLNAGAYDTGEFMLGTVAVGLWLLDANDPHYVWSQAEEDETIAGVQLALDYWVQRGGPGAALTFYLDVHHHVAVDGVPILNPPEMQMDWVRQALEASGVIGPDATIGDVIDGCYSFNNSIRDLYNTSWCYSIFVADSDPAVNYGFFGNSGEYALAYLGGPWIYMSRYCSRAANFTNYFSAVPMHETGHMFYATDEYDNRQQWSGYLNVPDTPGWWAECVMNKNETASVCTPTRDQLGWRDSDSDGIPDILDTEPTITLAPVAGGMSSGDSRTWQGVARVTTLPNENPFSTRYTPPHDLTITTIDRVECRVDRGSWMPATPIDGAFDGHAEPFSWMSPPLLGGLHVIEARARSAAGNVNGVPVTDTIRIEGEPPLAENLVLNPSFESSMRGWDAYHGSATARVAVADAAHGSYVLRVHGPATGLEDFGINDHPNWVVATPAPGARYRIGAFVRSATAHGTARLRVREYLNKIRIGSRVYSPDVELSPSWQHLSMEYACQVGSSSLDVQVVDFPIVGGESFEVDGVTIEEVSSGEPGLEPVAAATRFGAFVAPRLSPNPSRGESMLRFTSAGNGPVRAAVFDLSGRLIRSLIDEPYAAPASYQLRFVPRATNGTCLGPGIYFYRVEIPEGVFAGRWVILE